MTTELPTIGPAYLLRLGISTDDEKTYRLILQAGSATAEDVAKSVGTNLATAQRSLSSLESHAFVTRSLEQTPRYFAVPPDIAIPSLLTRRQAEAATAIAELRTLKESSEVAQRSESQIVEVLSRQAAAQLFPRILDAAQEEILSLERLPVLVSDIDSPGADALAALHRGVRIRTITDHSLLSTEGSIGRIRRAVEAGERYRVRPLLPFKLAIADRRVGMLPLDLAQPDGPILLVRSCSLLDALCDMFEMLWQSSSPFEPRSDDDESASPQAKAESEDEALIRLLAAGINDKVIEHELGVSQRTVARRIGLLMKRMSAKSRFQVGWNAAILRHTRRS